MTLKRGANLGPYEILSPLGAGGMGEVYRAKDTRLDREVAIKVLPEHLAKAPDALARFEREAKAVAALSHPNILAVHDVGTDQGVSFVVTELLEGETLRERLRVAALPWRKAVEIGVAIADGLAAAHTRRIVHRDVKPENIFLTRDGVVKILDFGLAHRAAAATPADLADSPTITLETAPGTLLGTAAYMSPEQVRGEKTDARSDVFSLGCVLYEMVSESRAFARKTVAETLAAILKDEPPDIAETGQQIPPELDRLIRHCLEKKPEERFQSARDLAFDLRTIESDSRGLKTAPVAVAPRSQAALWVVVSCLTVVMLAVVLVAVNVGGLRERLFGRGGQAHADRIESLAVLPLVNVGGDPDTEYLCEEIPATIIDSLSQLPHLRVVPRSTVFRLAKRDSDHREIARELEVRAVLSGKVTRRGGRLSVRVALVDAIDQRQLWGERYDRTENDILAVEKDIASQISDTLRLRLTGEQRTELVRSYTDNTQAYRAYKEARFWWNKRTQEGFRRAIELYDEAIRLDPNYALAYAGKADCYCLLGWYFRPPREAAPKAKEAIDAALALDSELPEAYPPLGWVRAIYDWDWPGAERAFQRAIELNPRYATAHHWYGVYLTTMGRFEDATREMQRAHELDPGSLIINRDVAGVLYFRRQFNEAEEQLQRTLEMDSSFVQVYETLGATHLATQEYDKAIAEFQVMHRLAGHFPRGAGLLGATYALAGQRDKAVEELRSLTELSSKGEYVPAIAFAYIHGALVNTNEAFEWMYKAVDEREASLPFLKVAPLFDAVRGDPRYDNLLRRIGFEPDVEDHPAARPSADKIMLAVLPFEDMSPEPAEWFSDGMTEEMIAQLG
ncbi:MAG: protein kinase, partial [Phycisphaerales bacterium]